MAASSSLTRIFLLISRIVHAKLFHGYGGLRFIEHQAKDSTLGESGKRIGILRIRIEILNTRFL
jgi:hypothetical protein